GLHYGPAFRQVAEIALYDDDLISVELTPAAEETAYLLDPMRLDCCCQGLIATFPELRAEERGVSYIPVRVDTVTLHRPGVSPHRSIIKVLKKGERSIYGDFHVFGRDGDLIATLTGVRCQAVQVRRASSLDAVAFVETSEPADGLVLQRTGV